MGKIRISENEKGLLHALGRFPDLSIEELSKYTRYKWSNTVVKKLEELREKCMLFGPFYDLYHDKLCKNPFHKLVCILELAQDYETAISYLTLIEPLWWISPILSHKKVLIAVFYSSDNEEMEALLQLLKDNNILSDYDIRVLHSRKLSECADLSGDPSPSLHNLLDPCDVPDMSLEHHHTSWSECDISVLPYLLLGFKNAKLIEILRQEKKQYRLWTYEQVRYSREKMIENGLIKKSYTFFPFPRRECAEFDLFFKTRDPALIPRILYNFARGGRVHKEYAVSGDWGLISCTSHPLFLTDLMSELDQIEEITEKEVYQTRSLRGNYFVRHFLSFTNFQVETQTLEYPYHLYREKIKEKLESECLIHE